MYLNLIQCVYMKLFVVFFCSFISVFFVVSSVHAKVLPRFAGSASKSTGGKVVSSSVGINPRLRTDRKALNVYFSNLGKAKSVSYTLMYQTNGRDEGAGGTIDSGGGDSVSRELLFGTCSAGVCRYHSGITNMKFEVTTELQNGKKTLRRFRVKV